MKRTKASSQNPKAASTPSPTTSKSSTGPVPDATNRRLLRSPLKGEVEFSLLSPLHIYAAEVSAPPFLGALLAPFSQTNVFIGKNSSGKTRLLRALFNTCKDRADVLLGAKQSSGRGRLQAGEEVVLFSSPIVGTPDCFEAVAASGEGTKKGPGASSVRIHVASVPEYSPHIPSDPTLEYKTDDAEKAHLAQALERANRSRPPSDAEEPNSGCVFFLSHRRGATHDREHQSSQYELASDASNLAGRVNTLFGSTEHGRRVRQAMLEVLPAIEDVTFQHLKDSKVRVVVNEQGRPTPLEATGGGIEQVLSIILALTSESEQGIIFIDEPESHLHEGAQRRLANYIQNNIAKRQLFISTHSPVFMTAFRCASIFKTRITPDGATVEHALNTEDQRLILDTLGAEAKTILQANATIWVEGSTEIEILRSVLKGRGLQEHEDFEFMITGGSMLARFSAEEDLDRIQMLRVCRNSFGIFDRDKPDGAELKANAKRVSDQLGPERSWITDDYEFEWYFPEAAVEKLWGVPPKRLQKDLRGKPFYAALRDAGGSVPDQPNKAGNARRVLSFMAENGVDWPVKFKKHIERLVQFIRRSSP